MPEVPLWQSPTFSTSTQEPRPDRTDSADGFWLRSISPMTASGLVKSAGAIAKSACAQNARVPTDRENAEDLARYALDRNIT